MVLQVDKIVAFRRRNLNSKIMNPNQHLVEISVRSDSHGLTQAKSYMVQKYAELIVVDGT